MKKVFMLTALMITSSAFCSSQQQQQLPSADQFKKLIVNTKSIEQQLDTLTKETEKNNAKALLEMSKKTLVEAYLGSHETEVSPIYDTILKEQKFEPQMKQLVIRFTEKILYRGDKIELLLEKNEALQSAADAFTNSHPLQPRKPNPVCVACELL